MHKPVTWCWNSVDFVAERYNNAFFLKSCVGAAAAAAWTAAGSHSGHRNGPLKKDSQFNSSHVCLIDWRRETWKGGESHTALAPRRETFRLGAIYASPHSLFWFGMKFFHDVFYGGEKQERENLKETLFKNKTMIVQWKSVAQKLFPVSLRSRGGIGGGSRAPAARNSRFSTWKLCWKKFPSSRKRDEMSKFLKTLHFSPTTQTLQIYSNVCVGPSFFFFYINQLMNLFLLPLLRTTAMKQTCDSRNITPFIILIYIS